MSHRREGKRMDRRPVSVHGSVETATVYIGTQVETNACRHAMQRSSGKIGSKKSHDSGVPDGRYFMPPSVATGLGSAILFPTHARIHRFALSHALLVYAYVHG